MEQLHDSKRFSQRRLGTPWTRWVAGFGAAAALAGGGRVLAIDAEQMLSYNLGNFLIQPQFDTSAQFTGNLFYGSDNPQPGGPVVIDRQGPDGQQVPVTIITPQGVDVQSDLIWYVSPGLELQYGKNKENSLSLGYFHDFLFYTDNSDFNTGQDRVQFGAQFQTGRITVVGNDNLGWLDTILGGTSGTAQRVPVKRLVWVDNYRVNYDYTVKTDFYAVFNHTATDYLQPVSLYDIGTLQGTLGATYKPSERIGLFAEMGGGHTDVTQNLPFPLMRPGEDSWVYGGYVGVRGTFTPRINGSVKVGYQQRDFTGLQTSGDGGGVAVGMALSYTPTERLLVNLAYDRTVGVSSQNAGQSYTSGVLGLSALQQIGTRGRWSVLGRLGLTFGEYSQDAGLGSGFINTPDGPVRVFFPYSNGRNDTTFTASVGITYQPRPWLTSSLTYSFQKFNTDFNDQYASLTQGLNDFVVNGVVLAVTVGF